ncbi:MAG: 30S ribosomal protein S3 [Candidatus Moanabacter tarae]|uniref:Small ribosomal subunit protein uS3 n=1 Tax=Candidatus Moanibacter tarae TaxID=2200854 RepID=A0A2Z4AEK1_9BACT|nr:MAG: 30S ribosomal protein S3 [Candidatus Moanabacter tarae]|tara:strand:+ start:8356 stop:8994 length:639 start_codon:yes stop_codon:yes gene_type:complete
MGQKVNPAGFRLQVRRDWESRWFADKGDFGDYLEEDYIIRKAINLRLRYAAVPRIFIERAGNRIRVKIFTARPGIVIGRKGQELEKLKEELAKVVDKEILLDIQEVKKPDLVAQLVAENVALQLERRISFRRAMKKAVQTSVSLGAEGIRIQVSGRLMGSDIARTEVQRSGRVPLNTLRENIDYGFTEARTLYGIIGVKCWICTGNEEDPLG